MVCPFRVKIEWAYTRGIEGYLEKSQTQEYPECYEEDCPFFSYPTSCKRVEAEEED